MPLAQGDDPPFDPGVDLVRTGLGSVRALGEAVEAALFIAPHPPIDGLTRHPIGNRRFADGQTVSDDGQDRVITLFHFAELHEHSAHLLAQHQRKPGGGRVSRISRYYVTDHPLLGCRSAVIDLRQIRRGNTCDGGR